VYRWVNGLVNKTTELAQDIQQTPGMHSIWWMLFADKHSGLITNQKPLNITLLSQSQMYPAVSVRWEYSGVDLARLEASFGLEATERKTQPYLATCNWGGFEASRLHGRRQQIRRPSDQWWTWECSRRVCHEKKEKKKIWPCTPFLTSSVMSHNHTTNKPCIHQRTARQVAACRPTNSTVMFTYLWEFVIYYYLLSTLHNNAQHLLTTVCKTTAFTVIATDIIIIIIFFYPS